MLLENKNIVITGASSGIGEQVAKKAASFGARPILIARSINKMKKLRRIYMKKAELMRHITLAISGNEMRWNELFSKFCERMNTLTF